VHQLFIVTLLQLLLAVIQTVFFSVPRFSVCRKKNPQKLKCFLFSPKPQKLPVIWYPTFIYIHILYVKQVSILFQEKIHCDCFPEVDLLHNLKNTIQIEI